LHGAPVTQRSNIGKIARGRTAGAVADKAFATKLVPSYPSRRMLRSVTGTRSPAVGIAEVVRHSWVKHSP
jgi:hypothetical protein